MELTVEKRDITKSPNTLRQSGKLPAVIYGRKEASTPISIDRAAFEKLYKQAGESTVISLTGLGEAKDVLVHEVSFHPVTGMALHADFYAIEKGQKVTVSIPLEFEGVAPAVKDLGGILVKVMHEIEIECDPRDLPQHITIDISALKTLDDKIIVKDLPLPKSAAVEVDADEVVAMVTVAQDEPTEAAPMDLSAIETSVERGKKEEDEAAAE